MSPPPQRARIPAKPRARSSPPRNGSPTSISTRWRWTSPAACWSASAAPRPDCAGTRPAHWRRSSSPMTPSISSPSRWTASAISIWAPGPRAKSTCSTRRAKWLSLRMTARTRTSFPWPPARMVSFMPAATPGDSSTRSIRATRRPLLCTTARNRRSARCCSPAAPCRKAAHCTPPLRPPKWCRRKASLRHSRKRPAGRSLARRPQRRTWRAQAKPRRVSERLPSHPSRARPATSTRSTSRGTSPSCSPKRRSFSASPGRTTGC
jgi:hypothetical protein